MKDEMNCPRVTVLMPAYNAARYVGEAIQSVLDQSYSDWELLIVNDGSTDNTAEIIESYADPRIRVLNNPQNLRLIKTLNRGLKEARGEYVARLDADDRAAPERLRLQMSFFESHPDLVMIGGCSNIIDEHGVVQSSVERRHCTQPGSLQWEAVFCNPFRHSAVTFRKDAVLAAGGYPEWAKDLEDSALWSKLMLQHDCANLKEILCDYRVHSESIVSQAKQAAADVLEEPRRGIASAVYYESAMNCGVPEPLAREWSRHWTNVRLPVPGEQVDVSAIRIALLNILPYQPKSSESCSESSLISAWACFQLLQIAFRQRDFKNIFAITVGALRHCPCSLFQKLVVSIRRKLQRREFVKS
jgi:glycosyltransferase involved in cell wall biosynthesis